MEIRHLIADPITRKVWEQDMPLEVDRPVNTKITKFIRKKMVPKGEKAVYTRISRLAPQQGDQ